MARVSRKQRDVASGGDCGRRTKVYKTAVYVRLSIEDIRKKISDSIGTQKAMLIKFLQAQPDCQLFDVYEDVNYTGTNFKRPGFEKMIADIRAGLVDCVIVKDLSRFGRNFKETGHYLERVFPFLQVRFISVNDSYDSLTASVDDSGLIVPLKNLMNENNARDISKKTQSAFEAKQKRGEFCGSFAPYGYVKAGQVLALDEETAPVVRQIFHWLRGGVSATTIAQRLNSAKICPPSRYRFEKGLSKAKKHENTLYWYKSAVKRIAENPVYTGNLVSRKYQTNFMRGGVVQTGSDQWIITEDAHPAIIDSDTYETVRHMREARKAKHRADAPCNSQDNIFKGLIICGDCGKHMARRKRRQKHTFVCNVHNEVDKSACTPKPIREADLHAALYAYISREITLAVDMTRLLSDLQKQAAYRNRRHSAESSIKALQDKLEQNRRFRGSLREDFVDGILSEQDYATMKKDYDEEKNGLQQELDALVADKVRQESTLSPENKWIAEFRRFETEMQLTAQMVSALVTRIDVCDGARVEITLRYRDEYEALRSYLNEFTKEARAV